MTPNSKYRPDIDGIRAIAVLSVLFYHLNFGLTGGFVGVDIFFVISGYLITSILFNSISNNSFSYLDFVERRIRRIYPPLVFMIVATLLVAYKTQLPADLIQTAKSAIAQLLSVSNVFFYLETGGYFGARAEIMPLLHTWSLSLEEQFYVFMPVILVVLIKYFKLLLIPVFMFTLITSFLLSAYGSVYHQSATFYLLPTRVWELGLGSLLPILGLTLKQAPSKNICESLSLLGLAAMLYAVITYDSNTTFPGISALLPCLGTVVLIWANQHHNTFTRKILSTKLMVSIGLTSYSVYLWHWPLIAFAKYTFIELDNIGIKLGIVSISMFIGYLSWRYIEKPFRNSKHVSTIGIFGSWAISTIGVSAICFFFIFTNGVVDRFSPATLSLANGSADKMSGIRVSIDQAKLGNYHRVGKISNAQVPDFFLWGDSHGQALFESLNKYAKDNDLYGEAAIYPGVLPIINFPAIYEGSLGTEAPDWNQTVLDYIVSSSIPKVIIVAAWNRNLRDSANPKTISMMLDATIEQLNTQGIEVWLLAQVPENEYMYPRQLAYSMWKHGHTQEVGPTVSEYRDSLQFEMFESLSETLTVLNPERIFYNDTSEHQISAKDNQSLYTDRDHLSLTGASLLTPLYMQVFEHQGGN